MINSIIDIFRELDFYELHEVFLNSSYYDVLFPFLLTYALFYTVLGRVGIFQYKKTKQPIKPVVVIISLLAAFYGISFEIRNDGFNVGNLLMMMFPSISALTIGVLSLYIVGAMVGKNFFKGLFQKDHGAFGYLAIGVIGLGSVIYYVGIAMGFWYVDSIGPESQWNTIIAIALLILGVVFLFIDMIGYAIVLLLVFGAFIYNSGTGNILEYFVDPVIFIILIVVVLIAWLNSDKEEKEILKTKIKDGEKSIENWNNKGVTKDYQAPVRDIVSHNLESNKKKWKKKYG